MKTSIFRIGSEAFWVFGGQVGVALGGLVGIKILTHLLSPHEFGRFSIANTIILLVGVNIFGPLGQGLMRYWSIVQYRNELNDYINASGKHIRLLFYISGLLSVLIGLATFFSHGRDWVWIIVLALISGAFTGWAGIRLSILVAARRRQYVSVFNVLTAFAKPLTAAILVVSLARQANMAVLAFLIIACASAVIAESRFREMAEERLPALEIDPGNHRNYDLGRSILSFAAPFFIWSLFAWAHQSCDRWALLTFQGADTVGAYSVIAQLAFYPLAFGSGFLSNFLIPIAYQRAGGLQSPKAINSGNKVLIVMAVLYVAGAALLILVFYFFHRQLVLLISNEKYAQYSSLLPMLTAAWSFYYFGQILSGFGFLVNRPNVYILPIVFSGLLATATTFFLVFKSGIIGVIWALGISGLFYAGWCLIIARRMMSAQAIIPASPRP
jgi:O-antigen/teichoic acid export membrane protein